MTTNPDKPQRKNMLRFAIFAVIALLIIVQTPWSTINLLKKSTRSPNGSYVEKATLMT